jgi:hypothetical protein
LVRLINRVKVASKTWQANSRITGTLGADLVYLVPLAAKLQPVIQTVGFNVTAYLNATFNRAVQIEDVMQNTTQQLGNIEVLVAANSITTTNINTELFETTNILRTLVVDINSTRSSVTSMNTSATALAAKVANHTIVLRSIENSVDLNTATLASFAPTVASTSSLINSLAATAAVSTGKLRCVQNDAPNSIAFVGCNVHVQNGQTSTESSNAKGNVVIGYNECSGATCSRLGSHNLVLGQSNSYASYGGIVAGSSNIISAPYATITGGFNNRATGEYASISGGSDHMASGYCANVKGGSANSATNDHASVTGGTSNRATGYFSVVTGGENKVVSAQYGIQ